MGSTVVAKRFVNTPTVLALHKQEFGEEGLEEFTEETLEDLSEEYDQVTGNEQLYKTIFGYLNTNGVTPSVVSGNEGFLEGVKKAVESVLSFFKSIFKVIWDFFTGRSSQVGNKLTDAKSEDLIKLAIKPRPYNSSFGILIGKNKPDFSNLNWILDSIKQSQEDVGKFKTLTNHVKKTMTLLKDQIKSIDKDSFDKESFKEIVNREKASIRKSFVKNGVDIFAVELSIDKDGNWGYDSKRVSMDPIPEYTTSPQVLGDIIKEVEKLNSGYRTMIKLTTDLENDLGALVKTVKDISDEKIVKTTLTEIKHTVGLDINLLKSLLDRLGLMMIVYLYLYPKKGSE